MSNRIWIRPRNFGWPRLVARNFNWPAPAGWPWTRGWPWNR